MRDLDALVFERACLVYERERTGCYEKALFETEQDPSGRKPRT
jgi:hypothetical protein